MHIRRFWSLVLTVAAVIAADARAAESAFTILHFSDTHIGPYLAREAPPTGVRGGETFAWMAGEVGQPQSPPGFDGPVPAPDFAVVTGDITEYGVIDDTWDIAERALGALPCPWYAVTGNHDNTWVAAYQVMRKRHGGANHSLDHQGWHFAFLSSASPQEPVPTLDATTRTWLQKDLGKIPPGTPVVLAMHHSPEIGEYANPAEMDTFMDLIRDYNVQLILVGHGHSPRLHDALGIPAIEGGSTFGDNSGYGLLTVEGQRVHYAYRRAPGEDDAKRDGKWLTLYDAPTAKRERVFGIAEPAADAVVRDGRLAVRIRSIGDPAATIPELVVAVDGETVATLKDVKAAEAPPVEHDVSSLLEGAHLLTVTAKSAEGAKGKREIMDVRACVFYVERGDVEVVWRRNLSAAVKAGPVLVGDNVIFAATDGAVTACDRRTGETRWRYATGGEILSAPAWSGELLIFGSGDGAIYALDAGGKLRWKHEVGPAVYGQPLVADGVAYLGDNSGRMHALDAATGSLKWTFSRADYSIEHQPATWGDALAFGAWDGYLYCLNRADGTLRWKLLGPKSSTHPAARYYAPADCGPAVLGNELIVCDRGYHLGTFAPDGTMGTNGALDVSALSIDQRGSAVYARHLDDRVSKRDRRSRVIWEKPIPAGRFPIPPTVRGDRVYVCSNRGTLSALAADTGAKIWTHQATAGFYVMAPVTVADDGVCFLAGMDGSLTAVRGRAR